MAHNAVQDRVLEYLGSSSRTRANYYFEKLGAAGFFTKDEATQASILDAVLTEAGSEHEGYGNQFRGFVSDVLHDAGPDTYDVQVRLQVPVSVDPDTVAEQAAEATGGQIVGIDF